MTHSAFVVGDSYLPASELADGLAPLAGEFRLRLHDVDPARRPELPGLAEYQGDPVELAGLIGDEDVLVVHAAAVTAELLDARPGIRIIACARGGPVNIELDAARDRGIPVLTTPGKNADAVADLTISALHLLFRRALPARDWMRAEAARGITRLDSSFTGGLWHARELRGHTLGLVGYGAVGRRVAALARATGMTVLVDDPYAPALEPGDSAVSRAELLERSDAVSIHARATEETRGLVDAHFLAAMRPGAFLINTARETLLDEDALLASLEAGHLAGAALDVFEPEGRWPELCRRDDVILTPHIGGATAQTTARGLAMLVEDLRRWAAGEEPLRSAV